ncbi:molybdopterin-dependent oxidoreductase [Rhodobacteraceae bacterium 2CG4]|uniref:Molybdopterin-dependent oxidoreductase n=1 Tax=Halovulum marinum TaxID=2662447 RepID=A0A6L5Z5H6_9RHOB|nr:molybdopterin-binding protein [Halovulum marinum]MSU91559.1 molybdopterin-dependent oxidoreductase [Halovulum marinum]
MSRRLLTRRRLLAGAAAAAPATLAGCDRLGASAAFQDNFLSLGEWLNYRVHRLLIGDALAREYRPEDVSPVFRTNGNTEPTDKTYVAHEKSGFAAWRLTVDGLVARPSAFTLDELRAMPARSQITRHDCVEGWSCVGQWTGVPLGQVLDRAGLLPQARFIVFHCADSVFGTDYYESIDLADAFHPQTILAYGMNGAPLPRAHGAPVRLRVERQLGYKHAKFVMRVEAVATLSGIGRGRGGFWEDLSRYEWYAGI